MAIFDLGLSIHENLKVHNQVTFPLDGTGFTNNIENKHLSLCKFKITVRLPIEELADSYIYQAEPVYTIRFKNPQFKVVILEIVGEMKNNPITLLYTEKPLDGANLGHGWAMQWVPPGTPTKEQVERMWSVAYFFDSFKNPKTGRPKAAGKKGREAAVTELRNGVDKKEVAKKYGVSDRTISNWDKEF